MGTFYGIQNVLSRIQTIQSRFKPPALTANLNAGVMPFDASLKMAMGAQNMAPMANMTGPDSLQALLNTMGSNNRFNMLGGGGDFSQKLVDTAKQWDGKDFKPGETARCADFVSTMIENSGAAPAGFKHEVNCFELQKQGAPVDKKDLKPGDIVYFGYTYLPVDFTHVGIYVGDGKVVHRPTSDKPVRVDSIETGYYADKYSCARRLQ